MTGYAQNAEAMAQTLALTPGWTQLCARLPDLDDDLAAAILDEAAKFAEAEIAPLDKIADRQGCRLEAGAVRVPAEYGPAYAALAAGGWLGIEQSPAHGGQGLPVTLFTALGPLFERACPAFMMAAGGSRAAALLLSEWADPQTAADWVPALIEGRRCATICISEPEAGSDLGRIRTRADQGADGTWRVTGQKSWISFGDHDMRDQIGHCLLARTSDAPGTRGISLFLVPRSDKVVPLGIEDKLGLHGSPTCALRFDGAEALLLGAQDRGLPQLFTMIRHMRLTTACQGLGVTLGALDCATLYAAERKQGGDPAAPAVPINQHADVQRQLRDMRARATLLRAALIEAAVNTDLSDLSEGPAAQEAAVMSAWMLPLIKNFGAEAAFQTASDAIQVLGGAGFTRDFPAEQALRDSRVFAIYEGTTGMQAQDFTLRRSLHPRAEALQVFAARARAEAAPVPGALDVIEAFLALSDRLRALPQPAQLAIAEPYLRAGWVAVQSWLAARLLSGPAPFAEDARHFLATAPQVLALHVACLEREVQNAGH